MNDDSISSLTNALKETNISNNSTIQNSYTMTPPIQTQNYQPYLAYGAPPSNQSLVNKINLNFYKNNIILFFK